MMNETMSAAIRIKAVAPTPVRTLSKPRDRPLPMRGNASFSKNALAMATTSAMPKNRSGRRKYNLSNEQYSEIGNVEEYALNYYLKEENLRGIHGENFVLPAIYFLLLWVEIYDDEIPLVFQSKYQAFPLDFFEKDFYINRKSKLDKKLDKIKSYKKEQLVNHIKITYETKNGIKNPCIEWNSHVYNEEILIKIGVAFGPAKLAEIFRVILNQGLKNVKTGMPDLFLWILCTLTFIFSI